MATIKKYIGNKIAVQINVNSLKSNDLTAKNNLINRIKSDLGISKRFSAILNNTYVPTIEELVVIAGHLEVTVDELLITE